MSTIDHQTAVPKVALRRLAEDRRATARAAVSDLFASLAPTPVAETWRPVGGIADSIVRKLARRTGRAVP